MECLTPPLDAVPVEEWFCPECVANNHHTSKIISYSPPKTDLHKKYFDVGQQVVHYRHGQLSVSHISMHRWWSRMLP